MDDFLTTVERAFRRRVRDHFRRGRTTAAADRSWSVRPAGVEGLLGHALVIEEASAASPKLGRAVLAAAPAPAGTGAAAGELAWAIGSASAALEAGLDAAREKGFFQSTLMGHQKVQGDLAEAFSAVQALRLKSYRALRLVDRGETARGEDELGRAAGEARAVRDRALALAGALLEGGRLAELMPDKERSGR